MSDLIWKGSREIEEQPGSPRIVASPNGDILTRVYRGPYVLLKSATPKLGDPAVGNAKLFCQKVSLVPDVAGEQGPGTLEVEYGPNTETVEIEWLQLDEKIVNHPMFNDAADDNRLKDEDRETLREWQDAPDGDARALVYARMTAKAREVVVYLKQGIESYRIFRPVVRITTESFARPKASKAGVIAALPATDVVGGDAYFWLVTADQVTRDGVRGKWRRMREYSGFDYIDNHIYDPESSDSSPET